MKRKTLPLAIALVSLFSQSYGAPVKSVPKINEEFRNPFGCKDAGYRFDLKVLELQPEKEGARESLYFVLNKINQPVTLYQMRKDESSRSLFLNNTINPLQWAVVASGQKSLKYICTTPDANFPQGKIVDCGQSLQVCEYVNVVFGLNNRGDYWLVRNNNRNGAVNDVIHYGIIPK